MPSFPKEERLCGKTAVGRLLKEGRWSSAGSILKYCVRQREEDPQGLVRVMISVPKKHFKRAVKRNLLKRRIREAYRLRKDTIKGRGLDLLLYYNSAEIAGSAEISGEIEKILEKL